MNVSTKLNTALAVQKQSKKRLNKISVVHKGLKKTEQEVYLNGSRTANKNIITLDISQIKRSCQKTNRETFYIYLFYASGPKQESYVFTLEIP